MKKREIVGFDREVTCVGEKRIDLAVDREDGRIWIELKHWLIGEQSGTNWQPKDYVLELSHEFEKLEAAGAGENAWIAVLCTRNPGWRAWEEGIEKYNKENEPWTLDQAALRPGRFDARIYVGLPDLAARRRIIEMHLADRPLAPDVNLDRIAEHLADFTGADIADICERAATRVFMDSIREGINRDITDTDIQAVLRAAAPSVSAKEVERYERWGSS